MTKQKDEADKMNVGNVEEEISGFEIGAVDKISYAPGLKTHNRYQIFQERDLEINGLEDNARGGETQLTQVQQSQFGHNSCYLKWPPSHLKLRSRE